MIKIKVNSQEWQVGEQAMVSDLLSRLKISPKVCVVELNGEIIDKPQYTTRTLSPGDQIEIIRMMGGG